MKKLLDSNGFSALEVALVVVVMGIIGGTGYYVYNSQKETKKLLDNTNAEVVVSSKPKDAKSVDTKPTALKTYSNASLRLSFDYQNDWQLGDGSSGTPSTLTFSSPDKVRVERGGTSFISEGGEIGMTINKTSSKQFEARDGDYYYNCEFGDNCTLGYFSKTGNTTVDGVAGMTGTCGHHSPGSCAVIMNNGHVYTFGYYQPNREVVGGSSTPEDKYKTEFNRLLSSVKFLK